MVTIIPIISPFCSFHSSSKNVKQNTLCQKVKNDRVWNTDVVQGKKSMST